MDHEAFSEEGIISLEDVKKDVTTIMTQRSYSEKDILKNTLELEKRNDIIYGNRDDIIIIKEQIKTIQKKIKK